jgi:DNA replication protein DnaC
MLDEEFYQNEMHRYKSAPVLYVDDLFKGKITDTDKNIVFEIINFRYLKMLPIIVSTEFSCERLLEFDEAIGSRIIQMCKGYMIELSGLDLNHRLL